MDDVEPAVLLDRAANGERAAWDELVERYAALVWSVARSFRFDDATTADVCQTVWLRLAEHCGRIREPDRLASWLATTTRHECYRVSRRRRREVPDDVLPDGPAPTSPAIDESLLDAEDHGEVLAAFQQLPESCQQLLRLLCADPPLDYATISAIIDRPIGSIGPTRARCLDKLRALLATTAGGR